MLVHNILRILICFGCLFAAGTCAGDEIAKSTNPPAVNHPAAKLTQPASARSNGEQVPIPVSGGKAKLSPANSKVMFVGIHNGNKPDPRTCGFGDFSGEAKFSADGKTMTGVSIEMQIESLYTFDEKLTRHLTSLDFFDAREYPTAKFESSKIEIGADGKGTLTGKLTLMKGTEEVKIPVKLTQSEAGFTLVGEVSIDRTKFGMDKMTDKIGKDVVVSFVLGEKTDPTSVLPK